jgi:tRNA G26 N,N-dimethylase Trm1
MSRSFKAIMAGLVAGIFFLGAPPAHAIFGIRAARTAIAARKAKKALAKDPNTDATERANENLARLEQESKQETQEREAM